MPRRGLILANRQHHPAPAMSGRQNRGAVPIRINHLAAGLAVADNAATATSVNSIEFADQASFEMFALEFMGARQAFFS